MIMEGAVANALLFVLVVIVLIGIAYLVWKHNEAKDTYAGTPTKPLSETAANALDKLKSIFKR